MNMELPYPYFAAIAERSICPNFYELDRGQQDAAVSEVKEAAHMIAVEALPAESYSDRERLIKDALTTYSPEAWEVQWLLSINPPSGFSSDAVPPEDAPDALDREPAVPVTAKKKEKK